MPTAIFHYCNLTAALKVRVPFSAFIVSSIVYALYKAYS